MVVQASQAPDPAAVERHRIELLRGSTYARHAHARKCKEHVEDCGVCQANVKWFAALPPRDLSAVLRERRK
jgi:hypothetical protein